MPKGQKFDIFLFLIVQLYSNGNRDCKNNANFDNAKGQL